MRLTIKDLQDKNVFFCSKTESHYYRIVLENIFALEKKSYCEETSRTYCKPLSSKTLDFPHDVEVTAQIPATTSSMLILLLAKRAILNERVVLLLLFYEKEIVLDWFDLKNESCSERIIKSFTKRFNKLQHTEHGVSIVDKSLITFESNRMKNSSPTDELKLYLSKHSWNEIGVPFVNAIDKLNTAHKRKLSSTKENKIHIECDQHGQTGFAGDIPISVEVDAGSRK